MRHVYVYGKTKHPSMRGLWLCSIIYIVHFMRPSPDLPNVHHGVGPFNHRNKCQHIKLYLLHQLLGRVLVGIYINVTLAD